MPLPAEPWPRIVSVMLHRTGAQDKPALVVPAAAEAPPVDPLFDMDRMERLLKRGEKPTR